MYIKTSNGSFEIPFEPTNKQEMMDQNIQYDVYTGDNGICLKVYFDLDSGESWITLEQNNKPVQLKPFLLEPIPVEEPAEVVWR